MFLSTLACEFWFIYNLLSMALFSYDSQRQQINLRKMYRAFSSDFFVVTKNKKADRLCMKFSSATNANV